MTLEEIKNEIRSLPMEQKRELTSDLIEEISAEDFPVGREMLEEVGRRLEGPSARSIKSNDAGGNRSTHPPACLR
jgi:hypothetical protein